MAAVAGEGRAQGVGKAEPEVHNDGDGPRFRTTAPKAASATTVPAAASSPQSDGTGSASKAAARGQGFRLELTSRPVILGAAVLFLGVGAWCSRGRSRGHHFGAKFHGLDLKGSGLQPLAAEQAQAADGSDSLEDILRQLEDGQEAPVDFTSAGDEAALERKASKKRSKKAKKSQPQEAPAEAPVAAEAPRARAEEAEEAQAPPAPQEEAPEITEAPPAPQEEAPELREAPPAPQEEAPELREARAKMQQLEEAASHEEGSQELQEAKDALARLEEAGSASKDSDMKVEDAGEEEEEEDPRVHEIMEEVLEKISKASKSKSGKVNKRKVKAAINNAIEKLEALPDSASREDLKERLREMLEVEEDESPGAKKGKAKKSKKEEEEAERHMDFAQRVKEETAKKLDYSISDVKEEFKQTYGKDAKSLMCSGCKLVAARLDSELSTHDVHEADNPAAMIQSKRKALDATCTSFRHLRVAESDTGLRFQATEAEDIPGEHSPLRMEQKLCHALLEDAKFDLLARMLQNKAMQAEHAERAQMSWMKPPEPRKENNERWLCADRKSVKMCKRSEVRDDDEEEEL